MTTVQQTATQLGLFFLGLLGLTLLASPVAGQVFDSGPSDSALFDTVISIPPDPNIINNGSPTIAGGDGLYTQFNVSDGGNVGGFLDGDSGGEINLSGGTVNAVDASSGSELNISGGTHGTTRGFDSEVNISGGSVGRFIAGSGGVVNISGGTFTREFEARSGSVVDVRGGSFWGRASIPDIDAELGSVVNVSDGASLLSIAAGGEVNISGGSVDSFFAESGGEVNISGGFIGREFGFESGSDIEVIGADFTIDGSAISDSTVSLFFNRNLRGTLADGNLFLLSHDNFPRNALIRLTRVVVAPPVADLIVSTSRNLYGVRPGQTLTLQDGGELGDDFQVLGGTFNIEGGVLGRFDSAIDGTVNISGGSVGFGFEATGGVVNVSGGSFDSGFHANSGSEVNISGGSIDPGFEASSGGVVNISGGTFFESFIDSEDDASGGRTFNARSGSEVTISGGNFGLDFEAAAGSDVELIGGDFKLNGSAFTGSTITLNNNDVFTGTLADGSPFIFREHEIRVNVILFFPGFDDFLIEDNIFSGVQLTSVALPTADLSPITVSSSDTNRTGLRAGQTLTLQDGGELGDGFDAVGAIFNIEGGNLGNGAAVADSTVNISGGTVGDDFNALLGSVVNISGGTIGFDFTANEGSVINISGGNIGVDSLGRSRFGSGFGSEVNLFGSDFAIDGVPLGGLTAGEAFTIVQRGYFGPALTGVFVDGTPFRFDLSDSALRRSFFQGELTVTVVPEPGLPGDVNLDGVVDFFDIAPFIAVLSKQTFQFEADIDGNGVVGFFDIQPFIDLLSGQ